MKRERVPFLDLTRQTRALGPALQRSLKQVLARGEFILGSEVDRFEREFARFAGTRFAVGVASGTDALVLSLQALGVGPGDRVATVSFTFLATADAILHVGATPLFVDIDPATFTMDPQDLESRLKRLSPFGRKKVKAVIPVHLYGHPCDMTSIRKIARKYRLAIVEDAAQAAGARWKGRPVGSLGELGCFSFFPTKNLGGFGDGGMVTTDSPALAERLRSLRVHGRQGEIQTALGRNSRLDELQAALLRVKLRHLPEWVRRRRRWAAAYRKRLAGLSDAICPVEAAGADSSCNLFVIRSGRREKIRRALAKEGIGSRVYYTTPLHRQPLHRGRPVHPPLRETEKACREVLALPIFPELRPAEFERVCKAVAGV